MLAEEAYNTLTELANVRAEAQALAQRWIQAEHEIANWYRSLERVGFVTESDLGAIRDSMGKVRRLIAEKVEDLLSARPVR